MLLLEAKAVLAINWGGMDIRDPRLTYHLDVVNAGETSNEDVDNDHGWTICKIRSHASAKSSFLALGFSRVLLKKLIKNLLLRKPLAHEKNSLWLTASQAKRPSQQESPDIHIFGAKKEMKKIQIWSPHTR